MTLTTKELNFIIEKIKIEYNITTKDAIQCFMVAAGETDDSSIFKLKPVDSTGTRDVIQLIDHQIGLIFYRRSNGDYGPITNDVLEAFPLSIEGEAFVEKYLKEMEEEKEGMGLIIELINTEEYSALNVLEKVKRLKPVLRQMMAESYKIDWKIVIDSLRKKSSRPDYNIFPDSLDGFSYADFIILYTKIEGAYENDTYFIKRTCRDCGATFHLYKSEVEFFNSKDLVLPKRCKSCRIKNKQ